MIAVFKREFKTMFTGPIAYFVWALLFFFAGLFFFNDNVLYTSTSMTGVFGILYTISMLLVVPILSMRLFSEDRRNKTDQALLTAPVSLTGVVVGKYLAALLVFLLGISITLVFAVVMAMFDATPAWASILGNWLGLALLGGNLIAAGMFFSTLTESQFIAALCTFAFSYVLMMMDSLATLFGSAEWLAKVVEFLSVNVRYNAFAAGEIGYGNVLFFLSMQALFLFLAVRVLDSRKWK
ncbi:MAG: ABC-2 transporter permease [Clostridia bacterium]|nr:ABC-2 transporter permease [Clostridia bacterium]